MKIFRIVILFLVLLSIKPALAQQVESLHSIKLGLTGTTYSYELALGKQFSINFEAGGHLALLNNSFYLKPVFLIEPRLYYNIKKRFDRGKFLNNSASFFSLNSGFIFGDFSFDKRSHVIFFVPTWGFRRAIGKHFIFETQIGGGVQFNRYSTRFRPDLNLKFGYVF